MSVSGLWDLGFLICWMMYSRERLLPTSVRLGPLEPPSPLMVWHSMHLPAWNSLEPRDSHAVKRTSDKQGKAIHLNMVPVIFFIRTSQKKGEEPHVRGPSHISFVHLSVTPT
jgi:hypothetical protein